jgi:ABC-type transporter Mla maintaining outer membrane lipid asymmetry permease subunit MlaE
VHVVQLVGLFIGMIVALQTGLELRASASRTRSARSSRSRCAARWARSSPHHPGRDRRQRDGGRDRHDGGREELAALEVMSIDRISYLVLPRVVGVAMMCPLLTMLCDTIGIVGGGFVAQSQLNVELALYYDSVIDALQRPRSAFDAAEGRLRGLFKAFVFGIVVA